MHSEHHSRIGGTSGNIGDFIDWGVDYDWDITAKLVLPAADRCLLIGQRLQGKIDNQIDRLWLLSRSKQGKFALLIWS